MYSALSADVKDPSDPRTALNEELLIKLQTSDRVRICNKLILNRKYYVQYCIYHVSYLFVAKLCLIQLTIQQEI